ncbi:hypothetical protein EVG20_g8097 [Dentipellis fragilis]|uniref:Uncharacterized protein n=1 Tax=Dentipellis fragilis TaxID=205917 RepID=A0A4Y9Y7T5_9AGAM|nr:hypothetical protein EVG20_g8097 [Dentipellis fragilis]
MTTENPPRSNPDYHKSAPIPISTGSRRRAMSVSSTDSSPSSPPIQTPVSAYPPKVSTASPSTSPLLSYFMSSSPTKANATFPLRRPSAAPVFEDDEGQDVEVPAPLQGHHRRATTAIAGNGRFAQQQVPPPSVAQSQQQERGVGVLRRLSLGGSFGRPTLPAVQRTMSPPPLTAPPPSAVTSPTNGSPLPASPMRKTRRSATVSARSPDRRRAPSPMGERILKGHFDGFN